MKRFLSILCFSIISVTVLAQSDKDFWFAVPYISPVGGDNANVPIYLRICAGSTNAIVNVTIPASGISVATNLNVNANTTTTVNLTPHAALLYTYPSEARKQNNGLHITASEKITVYFENGILSNALFEVLKGKNAIGKEFYTPFQTEYPSGEGSYMSVPFDPDATSSFTIVATKNGTVVNITSPVALVGEVNNTITANLDSGQTYMCTAKGGKPGDQPKGAHITSNYDIAVSMVEDQTFNDPSYFDAHGDQLVPVEKLGTKYILPNMPLTQRYDLFTSYEANNLFPLRDALNSNSKLLGDRYIIMATKPNTNITIYSWTNAGVPTTITQNLANAGNSYTYQFIPITTSGSVNPPQKLPRMTYLSSDQPVYVYHLTGYGQEFGGSLLPSTELGGSKSLKFNIINSAHPKDATKTCNLFLMISLRNGGQGNFSIKINGQVAAYNPATDFFTIANSGGYVGAILKYSLKSFGVAVGQEALLEVTNPNTFTLGVVNGIGDWGSSYGVFSDFVEQSSTQHLYAFTTCSVPIDIGTGKSNINWNTGETTQTISTLLNTVWATYKLNSTTFTDTFVIHRLPPPDLGADKAFCPTTGETVILNASFDYAKSYLWSQGGAATPTFTATTFGKYSVTVSDGYCNETDEINLTSSCGMIVNINASQTDICGGTPVTITAEASGGNPPYKSFQWDQGVPDGAGPHTVNPLVTTTYHLTVTDNLNMTKESQTIINVTPMPSVFNVGSSANNYCFGSGGVSITLSGSETGVNYQLQKDGTDDGVIVTGTGNPITWTNKLSGTYTVIATNSTKNCIKNMTGNIQITEYPLPDADAGQDVDICLNQSADLVATSGQGHYEWSTNDTTAAIKVSPAVTTTYTLTVTNNYSCSDTDEVIVTVNPLPVTEFSAQPLETVVNNPVVFSSDKTSNVASWEWKFGDGATSFDPASTTHSYTEAKKYDVLLTVTSSKNCKTIYSKPQYITVKDLTKIYIPSAFTPNGDGQNDVLMIYGEFLSLHLEIYNQWGLLVCSFDGGSGATPLKVWDGKYKGVDQPEGNYTYVFHAFNFLNNEIIEQGLITLLR